MAHKCLYCGKEILPENVLFTTPVYDSSATGSASVGGAGVGPRRSGGLLANAAKKETAAVEVKEIEDKNSDYIGKMRPDDIFEEKYGRCQYMDAAADHKKWKIFTVRWHDDDACKGFGEPIGELKPGLPPMSVRLCEEDEKAIGGNYSALTRMICPECHAEIPRGFFEVNPDTDVERICMMGGPASGKTQYIVSLFQNASTYLNQDEYKLGYIEFEPEARRILKYLGKMLESGSAIPATPFQPILPLVFGMRPRVNGAGGTGKTRFVVLYDVPGEIFKENEEHKLVTLEGVNTATSAMFLFDCAQVFKTIRDRRAAEKETGMENNEGAYCDLSPYDMMERAGDYLKAMPYQRIALTVTKCDQVWNSETACKQWFSKSMNPNMKRNNEDILQSRDANCHVGGVDATVLVKVDSYWSKALKDPESSACTELYQRVKGAFPKSNNIRTFAVSTFAHADLNADFVNSPRASIDRHRILEPMLWLLTERGFLPTKRFVEKPTGEYERKGFLGLKKVPIMAKMPEITYPKY